MKLITVSQMIKNRWNCLSASIIFLSLLINGCNVFYPIPPSSSIITSTLSSSDNSEYLITFNATIALSKENDSNIYIEIFNDPTDLKKKTSIYKMEHISDDIYTVDIISIPNSIIKYKYLLEGSSNPISESNPLGWEVKYRTFYVTKEDSVNDIIYSFSHEKNCQNTGRIEGEVVDPVSKLGIADIQINIGGNITYTASDGSYNIDCLSPGKHNIVANHINNKCNTFQQEAIIAENSTTAADFALHFRNIVDVTFNVNFPKNQNDEDNQLPLYLISNNHNMGNTYSDKTYASNTMMSNALKMEKVANNQYSIKLSLPAGMDMRYAYTFGDNFINSELDEYDNLVTHQIIIPEENLTIIDEINPPVDNSESISFILNTPLNTEDDDIGIKFIFDDYITNPIKMVKIENHKWLYSLNPSKSLPDSFSYCYCRNDQCDYDISNYSFSNNCFINKNSKNKTDTISEWPLMDSDAKEAAIVTKTDIEYRNPFIAGVGLSDIYSPTYINYYDKTFAYISELGANLIIYPTSWEFQFLPNGIHKFNSENNLYQEDMVNIAKITKSNNLEIAIFPKAKFSTTFNDEWNNYQPNINSIWAQNFFKEYERFIIHNAVTANKINASAIVLEFPLPQDIYDANNELFLGINDINSYMVNIVNSIRKHYSGAVFGVIELSQLTNNDIPEYISKVDHLFIKISPPLIDDTGLCSSYSISEFLDLYVKSIKFMYNKPITLSIEYPSIIDAKCITYDKNDSLWKINSDNYLISNVDNKNYQLNLKEQADFYNEVFLAVNTRRWVSGIVSDSFYPPTSLMDMTASVHGKPAADVIWFWYTNMLTEK